MVSAKLVMPNSMSVVNPDVDQLFPYIRRYAAARKGLGMRKVQIP